MPMNMMQSILDKTGLGGFRTGISDRDQLIHSNQDLADKELINRRNTNLYENELLDNPLKAAERAMKLAKAESDTTDITSGGYDKQRQLEREKQAAELAAKLDDNQRKKIEDAANAAVRAASIFKEDDTPLLKEQKWGTAAQILRDAGQTNVPDRYDPTAYEALMMRAKAAPMTLQHIQTLAGKDKDHANAIALSTHNYGQTVGVHQMDNEAAMERQRLQSKTTMDAARLRESGEWSRHNSNPALSRNKEVVAAKNRVDAAIEGKGEASLNDFAMVAKDLYGSELSRAATLLAPALQAETQQLRMDIATAKTPEEKKAKEQQLRNLARDAQKEMESMAFPPEFAAKYDEIRRKKYGSVDNAPVPEPIAQALAPKAKTGNSFIDGYAASAIEAQNPKGGSAGLTTEQMINPGFYTDPGAESPTSAAKSNPARDALIARLPKDAPTPPPNVKNAKVVNGVVKAWLLTDGTIVNL